MANTALRQIFLEAAIEIGRRGDTETARGLVAVVQRSDRDEVERRGRKRGEVVANRQTEPPTCPHCDDAGVVRMDGRETDCGECRP